MTPTEDVRAQERWREAAYALRNNSAELLAPLEGGMVRIGLDFGSEVTAVAIAAVVQWAAAHPDDVEWWSAQLAEQGRLVEATTHGLSSDEYAEEQAAGIAMLAGWLRIEPEWRTP